MNKKADLVSKYFPSTLFFLFMYIHAGAQVPVTEEPNHHLVFQNQYFRLLDVWIKPGDTTQFHIHSTPSLFVQLTNNCISSQVKGKEWIREQAVSGKTFYRSFSPDNMVHRVTNCDTTAFHVNDIELLSVYDTSGITKLKPLPFTVILDNDLAFVYQIRSQNIKHAVSNSRRPLIAELAGGNGVSLHDLNTKKIKALKAGQFLYIAPGSTFYFSASGPDQINMVLLEIK